MKSIYLKIKLKHLAEESRINRAEAERQFKLGNHALGNSITEHRKHAIRPEARATLLAYQYMRGIPYKVCEPTALTEPNWKRVETMIRKYGTLETPLEDWRKTEVDKAA